MNQTQKLPPLLIICLLCYSAVFIFSAINPASRAVWIAEIIPVILALVLIVTISLQYQFSNTAILLMFVWIVMHTIGGKYTFAEVPFDWFNDLIGSDRNNFDRVGHYSIGYYAYPIAEYLYTRRHCGKRLAMAFGLLSIMSLAAAYEIIEWWYAVLAGGEEGIAFLGSQGDIWDAQKDMLCDTLGAVTVLVLFSVQYKRAQ